MLSETLGVDIERDDLLSLYHQDLINLTPDAEGHKTGADDEQIGIKRTVGLAVLINGAPRYLDRVIANYIHPKARWQLWCHCSMLHGYRLLIATLALQTIRSYLLNS